MKKIVTVIGARPQIIKSAALTRAIATKYPDELQEIVVHTGQHYDKEMSEVFFTEMGLEKPNYNLGIGSGSHGKQTAKMIMHLEEIFEKENPAAVVVYGDTNSTLATAIAASKMQLPVVHIEAGLRSFNKAMPEEINRIMCDHASTLLFSPTQAGIDNLQNEGFITQPDGIVSVDRPKIYHSGDIMYDNSLYFSQNADQHLPEELKNKSFFLATVHRPANTDYTNHLHAIFEAFLALMENYPQHDLVLPLHPRTHKCMEQHFDTDFLKKIKYHQQIKILPPASFLTMVALEKKCDLMITDSGGLQKEAYFFHKPCVILRPETEWVEIVQNGTAVLADCDKDKIVRLVNEMYAKRNQLEFPPLFGDGKAAEFIAQEILIHC